MAKLYLYHPSSGLYGCPLAMTDGAAKSIEALGLPEHLHIAFSRLTTRDPDRFWTSGQWMTERGGGSDVGMFPYLSVRYRMKCSFDVGSQLSVSLCVVQKEAAVLMQVGIRISVCGTGRGGSSDVGRYPYLCVWYRKRWRL